MVSLSKLFVNNPETITRSVPYIVLLFFPFLETSFCNNNFLSCETTTGYSSGSSVNKIFSCRPNLTCLNYPCFLRNRVKYNTDQPPRVPSCGLCFVSCVGMTFTGGWLSSILSRVTTSHEQEESIGRGDQRPTHQSWSYLESKSFFFLQVSLLTHLSGF